MTYVLVALATFYLTITGMCWWLLRYDEDVRYRLLIAALWPMSLLLTVVELLAERFSWPPNGR